MDRREANWSELFPEMLSKIAGHIRHRSDLHNFRAICKNWRSTLSSHIPNSLPHLSSCFPQNLNRSSRLAVNAVFLLRPRNSPQSKPFLVTLEEFNKGKLRLFYPLTRNRILIEDATLNLSNFHVSLIGRRGYMLTIPDLCGEFKVVVYHSTSNPFLCVWNCFRVFLMRSGHSGRLFHEDVSEFDDVVEFKKRVYAIDGKGRLYGLSDELGMSKFENRTSRKILEAERVVSDSISSGCGIRNQRKRLAVDYSTRMLYLVDRASYSYSDKRIHLDVYKLNEELLKWDKVSSIGEDKVLFVGDDWCFFAAAADFPGCRGNCVIFSKHSLPTKDENGSYVDELAFLFEGSSKELEMAVFHLEDEDAGLISAYPGYSDVLWPPPEWFNMKLLKVEKNIE